MRRSKDLFIFVLFLIILGVAKVWGAETGEEHHGGVTPEQIRNFIWFTLNFIALVLILYKYARKPVADMFRNRRENLLKQYNELLEKKKEAEAKYIELQEKVKNLEKEAEAIYQNYVEQGIKEKERIIAEAEAQAERIKQQAELYIQQEIEKAKKVLAEEAAEASVKLAEEILRKNINEEDQKRIFKEFINEIKGRVLH
ncbi:F0F1 ATP synthase subunit B [Thermodesulfobacterium hydrogeniphilum]|uniref:F0F1 ATP synthase subunit B n=1 Tax=Thermodesulfobacterium hydrogeniphilum TaxID=161156 RepID=UPI0005717161|nr:F0F1 ATP synthase subunit B [Thermodesulfobacterium hydrogeniphilum]